MDESIEMKLPEVGSRARLRHVVDRYPHFVIEEGATGRITESSESRIALKMDEVVPGAEEWDNELWWTDDDGHMAAPHATGAGQISAAFHADAEIIGYEIPYKQGVGIAKTIEMITANADAEFVGYRILENGGEFGGYPDDALIVEFTYRDAVSDPGIPGREVAVFDVDGEVLDAQDFG